MLPVAGMTETIKFYTEALGFELGDTYEEGGTIFWCHVKRDSAELFFVRGASDPQAAEHRRQMMFYFYPDDVVALHTCLSEGGYGPSDLEITFYGLKEFSVHDPSGYRLMFGQPTDEKPPMPQPIPVERVTIEARVEKRLAAVVQDLIESQGRSMGAYLEEALLHTFEPEPGQEGQWCASPHNADTLKAIDELKARHGLDYNTHDSYRFTEDA